MQRFVLATLVFGIVLSVWAGCGGSREALLGPGERTTYGHTNTIALAPLNVAARERPQAVLDAARHVERVLTGQLEEAGFRVIPSPTTRAVYDTLALDTQNKYDAATGDVNPQVMAGLKAAVARAMATQHGADAVLFPEIHLVQADIRGGTAEWDGVREPVPVALQNETAATRSRVPDALAALSLGVEVVTRAGETLYEERGGIEYVGPLRRTERVPVLLRDQVEQEGMLAEPRRTERAVLLALEVFTRKKAVAGTAVPE